MRSPGSSAPTAMVSSSRTRSWPSSSPTADWKIPATRPFFTGNAPPVMSSSAKTGTISSSKSSQSMPEPQRAQRRGLHQPHVAELVLVHQRRRTPPRSAPRRPCAAAPRAASARPPRGSPSRGAPGRTPGPRGHQPVQHEARVHARAQHGHARLLRRAVQLLRQLRVLEVREGQLLAGGDHATAPASAPRAAGPSPAAAASRWRAAAPRPCACPRASSSVSHHLEAGRRAAQHVRQLLPDQLGVACPPRRSARTSGEASAARAISWPMKPRPITTTGHRPCGGFSHPTILQNSRGYEHVRRARHHRTRPAGRQASRGVDAAGFSELQDSRDFGHEARRPCCAPWLCRALTRVYKAADSSQLRQK